jgi:hypothetical protein
LIFLTGSLDRVVYTVCRTAVNAMRVYYLSTRQSFLGNNSLPPQRVRNFTDGIYVNTWPFFINSAGKDNFRVRLSAVPLEDKLQEKNVPTDVLERKISMLLRPPVDSSLKVEQPWDVVHKLKDVMQDDETPDKVIYEIVKKRITQHRHMLVNIRAMEYVERYPNVSAAGEEKRLHQFYVS